MKKIVVIATIIIILIAVAAINLTNIQGQRRQAQIFNKEYEGYQNKNLYGIDIITVINKATDNNEKYEIAKDKDGMYIEDEKYSIKVELNLISDIDDRTGEPIYVTRQMERLQEVGLEGFITNFNLTTFQCEKIEYHQKTGRVSKIVFKQIEE